MMLDLDGYAEQILENLPVGLLTLTPKLTVISANQTILKHLACGFDAIRDRPLGEALRGADIEQAARRTAATGQPSDLTTELILAGGRSIAARVQVASIRSTNDAYFLCVIVEDLSEQLKHQQALAANETTLLRAQAVAHIGSWTLDFRTGLLSWAPETYRIFDVPAGTSLSYAKFLSCVHPDDRSRVKSAWQAAIKGAAYRIEHRLIVRGETRWVEERAEIERDNAGRPLLAIGTVRDITEKKETKAAQHRLLAILEATPDFVSIASPQGKVLYYNHSARQLLGIDPEKDIDTIRIPDTHPEWAAHKVLEIGLPTAMREGTWEGETALLSRDGKEIPVSQIIIAHRDSNGQVEYLSTVARDIRERKQSEAQINRLLRTYALLTRINQTIVRDNEPRQLFQDACHIAVEIGGFRLAWVGIYDDHTGNIHPEAWAGLTEDYIRNLRLSTRDPVSKDGPSARAIRTERPQVVNDIAHDPAMAPWRKMALAHGYRASVSLPLKVAGRVRGTLNLYASDIDFFDADELFLLEQLTADLAFALEVAEQETKRLNAEARAQQLAFYDPLTHLPNRTLFLDRLNQNIARAQRRGMQLALLFIDLDRFKEINDNFGHPVGDRVLVEVATRLGDCVRNEETVARLGGDEFIILLTDADQIGAIHVAERVQAALDRPLTSGDHGFLIKASVGIAFYPEDGQTPEDLLRHADIAMYQAKARDDEAFCFFDRAMGEILARRLELTRKLELALRTGLLTLHYQPQIDLKTNRQIGVEALARWKDPEWGWISPSEFIPIAEERGFIRQLGEWALHTAATQLAQWKKAGDQSPDRIAVNIGAAHFGSPDFVDSVCRIVRDAGIPPQHIELELTETGVIRDPEATVEVTHALHRHGFGLAIDDFGTGYSSLGYLKRFAADKLKIDMSFVRDMLTDRNDHAIVATVIGMAKTLSLQTVAEGVETKQQVMALKELDCDLAQGYYFGRPRPAKELFQPESSVD
ncbi:MAG: EAL domain-containing protein [Methylohalobius sp. ZOD2]